MQPCDLRFEMLFDYWEGKLDSLAADQVRQHLGSGCSECASALSWMQRVNVALHGSVPEVKAPRSAVARAYRIARETSRAEHPRATLPGVLAWLVFDGRSSLALSGARTVAGMDFRSHYATREHDIDIWQEQTQGDLWYLIGQVLPRAGGDSIVPVRVSLLATDGSERSLAPQSAEFHVPDLKVDTYRVEVDLPGESIIIPDFDVGL